MSTSGVNMKDRRTNLSEAQIETLWQPQGDETVLWQGKPNAMVLAHSAFRARWVAGYFAVLAASALVLNGSVSGALLTLLGGLGALALLHGLAFVSARTTTYILTDRRVILHIGMAIEKTINLPLHKIGAAHLNDRGNGFGEIALEPAGEHTLGYLLLWPHARPWRMARPQPMLRALPDAATVAKKLANAVAARSEIARGDAQGDAQPAPMTARPQPAMHSAQGAMA